MSTITIETVKKVANLNRLAIDDDKAEAMVGDFEKILGFIEQLSEVDTDGVEPLANVVDSKLRLRKDEVTDGDCQAAVLANAPEEMQGFYVVPKVVE